jgi:hypothetical protein
MHPAGYNPRRILLAHYSDSNSDLKGTDQSVDNVILVAGLACLIAAIVGGGLKAFGIEVPVLQSRARQVILGVAGIALVFFGKVPQRNQNISSPVQQVIPGADTVPTKPITHDNQPMSVSVNGSPLAVQAGGSTEITVMVTTSDGSVVPDARVLVSAGGGKFGDTGAIQAAGKTNEQGVYHTIWSTYDANVYTGDVSYGLNVNVRKDGFQEGTGQITIHVKK